jgi:two-component system sensor histidine kinase VicK
MRLNTKIILLIAEVALIPWVVGGFIAFLSAQEQLNAATYTKLDALATLQKNRLQDTLKNKLDMFELFSGNPHITVAVRDYNARTTAANKKEIQDFIDTQGDVFDVKGIFIATTVGTVIASTDSALIGTDISTEEYFKRGLHANDESVVRIDETGTVVHYIAGPLIRDGHTEGVAVMVIDAEDIIAISQGFSGLGRTGETVLVESYNGDSVRFITATRFNDNAPLSLVVKSNEIDVPAEHALKGEEAVFASLTDYRGVKVLAATRFIRGVDWGIVVKIDQSEASEPVRQLGDLFLVIIVIVGFLIMVIATIMSRTITKPVNVLTEFAHKIAQGDLSHSIIVASKDEVGELAIAFNAMTARLYESYTTLEKKVAERTNELAEKAAEARNSGLAAMNIASDLKDEEEKLAAEKTKAESLADDLKKFKLALDNASDQVIITDVEGMVVYANPAVERITGYSPKEAVGKKAAALWKIPMMFPYYEKLWNTIKEQKIPFVGEIQNRRKDGREYTAVVSISPVLDKDKNIIFFVGIERDITKEKEIERMRVDFLSLASHQLRTPLSGTKWIVETLRSKMLGPITPKQDEYLGSLYSINEHMIQLVLDMLSTLRFESGDLDVKKAPIALQELFTEILQTADVAAKSKQITIRDRSGDHALPAVESDPTFLKTILETLLSNAINYSPAGGEIILDAVAEEGSAAFTVQDSGIGIPEDEQGHIFERFYRASNARTMRPDGTGLGLYTAKVLAEKMGGSITFTTRPNEGTTFTLHIPTGTPKPKTRRAKL